MTAIHVVADGLITIYQCDRCKRLMEQPTLGIGPGFEATRHYCELCSVAVAEERKQGRVQP